MHVGDVLHLRLHQLVVSGLVGELQDVERHPLDRWLGEGVEPGDIWTLVVDLRSWTAVREMRAQRKVQGEERRGEEEVLPAGEWRPAGCCCGV